MYVRILPTPPPSEIHIRTVAATQVHNTNPGKASCITPPPPTPPPPPPPAWLLSGHKQNTWGGKGGKGGRMLSLIRRGVTQLSSGT